MRSLQAARLVPVMKASVTEAAADTGLAQQVVHRLMRRIEPRMAALPGDWMKVVDADTKLTRFPKCC